MFTFVYVARLKPAIQAYLMANKRPVGRPTDYKPEYCQKLLEHMSKGLSFESFAGLIGVHKGTLYDWCEAHEEFGEAKEMAWSKYRLFMEIQAVEGLWSSKEKSFNTALYTLHMVNYFGLKSKAEADRKLDINFEKLSDDELETIVLERAKQIEEKKKK